MGFLKNLFKKKAAPEPDERDGQEQFLKDEPDKKDAPAEKKKTADATSAKGAEAVKKAEPPKKAEPVKIPDAEVKVEPKKEEPKKEAPKKAEPEKKAEPVKMPDAEVKAEPKKEEPKKEAPKKAEPEKKAEPVKIPDAEVKAEPKKEEPKKEAPKKAEQKKAEEPKSDTEKKDAEKKEAPKKAEKKPAEKKLFENDEPIADAPAPDENEDSDSETVTVSKITRNGNFDIKRAKDGRFYFNLYASNRARIASSQIYSSSTSAVNGIKSVIANAGKAPIEDTTLKKPLPQSFPKWEIYIDKAGEFRFRLYAGNGSCICHSHGYASKATCKGGIESIIRFAAEAEINKKYLK